jgi:hypothetical protein
VACADLTRHGPPVQMLIEESGQDRGYLRMRKVRVPENSRNDVVSTPDVSWACGSAHLERVEVGLASAVPGQRPFNAESAVPAWMVRPMLLRGREPFCGK